MPTPEITIGSTEVFAASCWFESKYVWVGHRWSIFIQNKSGYARSGELLALAEKSLFGNVELIVDLVVQRQGRLTITELVQPKEISFQEIQNR